MRREDHPHTFIKSAKVPLSSRQPISKLLWHLMFDKRDAFRPPFRMCVLRAQLFAYEPKLLICTSDICDAHYQVFHPSHWDRQAPSGTILFLVLKCADIKYLDQPKSAAALTLDYLDRLLPRPTSVYAISSLVFSNQISQLTLLSTHN